MKILLFSGFFLLAALAVPNAEGMVYERCQLVRELKRQGLDHFEHCKLADWVCMAKHESSYNTKAVHNNGKSSDYGIFQINSQYWCDDGKTHGSKNMCKISCDKFLDDDIRDDVECAKKIARQAKGMTPWVGWKKHCQKNVDDYVKNCF